MAGEYKVHEQLPLSSMSVSDVDNDPSGCTFYINHPTKSFFVIAESRGTSLLLCEKHMKIWSDSGEIRVAS